MGLRINTNIPALDAQRQTERTSNQLVKTLGQLSTGLEINKAADNAAGLAIAERLRTQVRQLNQEVSNLQSGVSAVQTAEGGLESQQEGVERLRELSLQAANGTLTDDQRAAINTEAQQIIEQIGQTADNTEFNGTQLLNGTTTEIELGTEGGNAVTLNESTVDSLGLTGLDLSTQEGAAAAVETADTALNRINQNRAGLGAQENALTAAIDQRETEALNEQAAESRIRDLDVAQAAIEQARNETLLQSGIAGIIQGNVQNETAAQLLGG